MCTYNVHVVGPRPPYDHLTSIHLWSFRRSSFFTALTLLCIILCANQRTKMKEAWERARLLTLCVAMRTHLSIVLVPSVLPHYLHKRFVYAYTHHSHVYIHSHTCTHTHNSTVRERVEKLELLMNERSTEVPSDPLTPLSTGEPHSFTTTPSRKIKIKNCEHWPELCGRRGWCEGCKKRGETEKCLRVTAFLPLPKLNLGVNWAFMTK